MKPPPFRYHAPRDVREALRVLADVGEDAAVLAGGQSLVPLLNMRLYTPEHLVDINRLPLSEVRITAGQVRVGALARHAQVERDAAVFAALPLLRRALTLVAHPAIRNRGTVVGSLVHADPAGELTAVLALLDGAVELATEGPPGGDPLTRTVAAREFFRGPMESARRAGELAVAAVFPLPAAGTGTAFVEVARRHGDYALAGVAAAVTVDADGRVVRARAAYLAAGPVPLVLDLTEPLTGHSGRLTESQLEGAARLARDRVAPEADIHATVAYRRHLAGVLTARAVAAAYDDATDRIGTARAGAAAATSVVAR